MNEQGPAPSVLPPSVLRPIVERPGDPEFMTSLARGLAVMRYVAESDRPVSIADAARGTGLSRAATRRCLYTLSAIGYVGQEEQGYVVKRQALSLGHPFLSLTALAARAQPLLDALRDRLGESCSLGVMEDDALYYVARAEAGRIMSVGLRVGSRLPLYPTAMGRILLGGRAYEDQEAYFRRVEMRVLTPATTTDRQHMLTLVRAAAREGYAIVDQELEMGVRSIAVPVTDRGQTVAALNVGTSTARVTVDQIRIDILPALQDTARQLSS